MSEDGDNILSDDEQYGTINCFDEFVAEEEIIDDLIDEALVQCGVRHITCQQNSTEKTGGGRAGFGRTRTSCAPGG
ncbi:hypothetical protein PVAP13_9NG455828 [Panicum virgatum]|uniref:Uncharacterized protein n=1 Tax=Panicum virgatum TaxID=38727 RepID=A0A8T0MQC9_PANVG|nr:hypothetical protein PVAP13_9NG455828 [Panicum virgatum]